MTIEFPKFPVTKEKILELTIEELTKDNSNQNLELWLNKLWDVAWIRDWESGVKGETK